MKKIIGNKTRFYSSLISKTTGRSFDNVLDMSDELKKEISEILPKGEDNWITEDSVKETFFFKKRKKPLKLHQPSSPRNQIQKEINAVNHKRNLLNARASTNMHPIIRSADSVIIPSLKARPKSLPKVIINGGYSLSQQKLLEIRELFFYYSAGAETITLDCSSC